MRNPPIFEYARLAMHEAKENLLNLGIQIADDSSLSNQSGDAIMPIARFTLSIAST